MTDKITLEQTKAAVVDVILRHPVGYSNPDLILFDEDDDGNRHEPICVVGNVISALELTNAAPWINRSTVYAQSDIFEQIFDHDARIFLSNLQDITDKKISWGQALGPALKQTHHDLEMYQTVVTWRCTDDPRRWSRRTRHPRDSRRPRSVLRRHGDHPGPHLHGR